MADWPHTRVWQGPEEAGALPVHKLAATSDLLRTSRQKILRVTVPGPQLALHAPHAPAAHSTALVLLVPLAPPRAMQLSVNTDLSTRVKGPKLHGRMGLPMSMLKPLNPMLMTSRVRPMFMPHQICIPRAPVQLPLLVLRSAPMVGVGVMMTLVILLHVGRTTAGSRKEGQGMGRLS